jgi:molybdate transport system regulatory protein
MNNALLYMNLQLKHRFWLETEQGKFLGHGRIELLELIEEHGSINKAALAMNMAYRKAWGLCQEMNQYADKPLIIQKKGGKSGGGTRLTAEGKNAITTFKKLEKSFKDFAKEASKQLNF